jgi:hypothetical protein
MIDVKVGIPHTLGSRHLSKHRVRSEFSIQTAEGFNKTCNGAQSAKGFRIVRLAKLVDGLVYFSPRAARKESLRWQII